jgi:hypothetical protein
MMIGLIKNTKSNMRFYSIRLIKNRFFMYDMKLTAINYGMVIIIHSALANMKSWVHAL